MALIKCPECGREISDKAGKCPHCGCPLQKQEDKVIVPKNVFFKKNKWIILAIALIIVIGGSIKYITYRASTQKENTYENALDLLDKGKYDEALNLMNKIPEYKDVSEIMTQAKFESYGYAAVKALKGILKNPDSLSVYDIYFYETPQDTSESELESSTEELESETSEQPESEPNEENSVAFPSIIMYYGAQNGFGGNTTGYVYCSYEADQKEYTVSFVTKTLDEDELDEDDDDYMFELLSTTVISSYLENREKIGDINFERFTKVVKNMAYTSVQIVG